MEDIIKRRLRTGAEIALIIGFVISLGVNIIPGDEGYFAYGCDKETVPDMMCYKLSRVNDNGIQRNCYYDRDRPRKYKVCSQGWYKVEELRDVEIPTCTPEQCQDAKCNDIDCPEGQECLSCPKETCESLGCENYATACDSCCPEFNYDCGGSSSCPTCPSVCELGYYDGCELIIAYTDDGKWFCDGVGDDATCVNEDLVEDNYCDI